MFIVYFMLWVAFNERLTLEVALLGAGISAVLYLFTVKFMDYSPRKEWAALKRLPRMIRYAGTLLKEIVSANLAVMKFILSPRYEVEPQLVYFKTRLKEDVSRVVLANSITITPGTITVTTEENLMCVHCLDKTGADGLIDSEFERQLMEMEAMDE